MALARTRSASLDEGDDDGKQLARAHNSSENLRLRVEEEETDEIYW